MAEMTDADWKQLKYFKRKEFESPDTHEARVDIVLISMLEHLRFLLGKPIKINSGYRTLAHNMAVGGVDDSAHTKGLAVDIAIPSSEYRFKVLKTLFSENFMDWLAMAQRTSIQRIGIGKDFMHIDIDATKPNCVVWLYAK